MDRGRQNLRAVRSFLTSVVRGETMRWLVAVLIGVLLGGCKTSPDVPVPPGPTEWSWPAALSEDGKWRLQIRHVELRRPGREARENGEGLKLQVQAALDMPDQDHLLALVDPVVAVVTADGVDRTPGSHSLYSVRSAHGHLGFSWLDVGEDPGSLSKLELRGRVIRVRRWKTHTFADIGPGGKRDLQAPPFTLFVNPERLNVWVGASMDDSFRDAGSDDPARLLSHDWAARAARVQDANRLLQRWGGSGSGGGTVQGFGTPMPDKPRQIAFPITVQLRVPEDYEVIDVTFRFADLGLPKPR
jgi:hypothetical protein